MVSNECLRFGVHVEIQVSYKILWFEIPKEVSILHQLPSFQEGHVKGLLSHGEKYLYFPSLCLVNID